METQFLDIGSSPILEEKLEIEAAKRTIVAVHNREDFKLIGFRQGNGSDESSEIVIVDCECDGVPHRYRQFKYPERLALQFFSDDSRHAPIVHALRSCFPVTAHQNPTSDNEPRQLCLYESWLDTRRSWTPERHLSRIQEWFTDTAEGTLHRDDQPVEPFYLISSKARALVLPEDFEEKISAQHTLFACAPKYAGAESTVEIGRIVPVVRGRTRPSGIPCIVLNLLPIIHGVIKCIPSRLGELCKQLEGHSAPIEQEMRGEIQKIVGKKPDRKEWRDDRVLLVLKLPIKRSHEGKEEYIQHWGFIIKENIIDLGVKVGALRKGGKKKNMRNTYHWIGDSEQSLTEREKLVGWQRLNIRPLNIVRSFTSEFAREMSGVESKGPYGLLTGVGALGSAVAAIWQREGWGRWHYSDTDRLMPHNLARHSGCSFDIGSSKEKVMRRIEDTIFPAYDEQNPNGKDDFNSEKCELIVDVTTMLLAQYRFDASKLSCPKAISFMTLSGRDSILLMEDKRRAIKADCLEAQYYRAVISRPWGKAHMHNHYSFRVGNGCRDISFVIPTGIVMLHAATLAGQIRRGYESGKAMIGVWRSNARGRLRAEIIKPKEVLTTRTSRFRIIWDKGIQKKVRGLREKSLPNETGGILWGYFNFPKGAVYIVDAVPAPLDSRECGSSFIRGTDGLEAMQKEVVRRTSSIVNYVGEWHSHPSGMSSRPSMVDKWQLSSLAGEMRREGVPVLMLIVGEKDEHWCIKAA